MYDISYLSVSMHSEMLRGTNQWPTIMFWYSLEYDFVLFYFYWSNFVWVGKKVTSGNKYKIGLNINIAMGIDDKNDGEKGDIIEPLGMRLGVCKG